MLERSSLRAHLGLEVLDVIGRSLGLRGRLYKHRRIMAQTRMALP